MQTAPKQDFKGSDLEPTKIIGHESIRDFNFSYKLFYKLLEKNKFNEMAPNAHVSYFNKLEKYHLVPKSLGSTLRGRKKSNRDYFSVNLNEYGVGD